MSQTTTLVIAEAWNGAITGHSLECVAEARNLDGVVHLAVIGEVANDAAAPEVDGSMAVATGDGFAPYVSDIWVSAIEHAITNVEPDLIIAPASIAGRDYLPRLAARFDAPMISDATAIQGGPEGIVVTRQIFGGRFQSDVRSTQPGKLFVTFQPGYTKPAPATTTIADATIIDATIAKSGIELLSVTEHVVEGKRLSDADRIVSGGRGLQNAENFELIEALAAELDAAVGASGAVVGQGWRSHDDQVGSTGFTVAPDLYLAVGISGAPQHVYGMRGSKFVAAINRDASAPIFQIADFGIVGDLFAIVPEVTRQLKEGE